MYVKTEVEPFVTVLRRQVVIARRLIKQNPKNPWALRILEEAHDYLYKRTIHVPWLPEPYPRTRIKK